MAINNEEMYQNIIVRLQEVYTDVSVPEVTVVSGVPVVSGGTKRIFPFYPELVSSATGRTSGDEGDLIVATSALRNLTYPGRTNTVGFSTVGDFEANGDVSAYTNMEVFSKAMMEEIEYQRNYVWEIHDVKDVIVTSPQNQDYLFFSATPAVWVNQPLSELSAYHTHDPRYYTKAEIDYLVFGISASFSATSAVTSGTSATIRTDIPLSHLEDINTKRLLGRGSGGVGAVEEITLNSDYGITFTYSNGSLKINTPQDLRAAADPQFERLGLGTAADGTASLNLNSIPALGTSSTEVLVSDSGIIKYRTPAQIVSDGGGFPDDISTETMLGRGTAGTGSVEEMTLSSNYGVGFTYATNSLIIDTPQDLQTTASPEFAGLTDSSLTTSRLMASDGSKQHVSVSNLANWIAGTSNRVTVSDDGDGTITLSGPQDIATSSVVRFARLGLGTTADGTASLKLNSIPALGSTASYVLVSDSNVIKSRTPAQVITDGGGLVDSMSTSRMLGRGTAGSGSVEEMVLSSDYGMGFTYAASSLKINTPQDLQTTAMPQFAGLTLTGNLAIGANYISNDGDSEGISIDASGNVTVSGTFTISGMVAGVADYDAFIVSDGGELKYRTGDEILSDLSLSAELKSLTDAEIQQLQNIGVSTISSTQWGYLGALDQSVASGDSPTFSGLALDGLTANRLVATDGDKILISVSDLTSWVGGTANQITVSDDGDGTVTLGTPQDIDTSADVQFGTVDIGGAGAGQLLYGYSASSDAVADMQSADTASAAQFRALAHGGSQIEISAFGSTYAGSVFGVNLADNDFLFSYDTTDGMGIGTRSANQYLYFGTESILAMTINGSNQQIKIEQTLGIGTDPDGTASLKLNSIPHLATSASEVLISDSGIVKYRTPAELVFDAGGTTGSGTTNYITKWTNGPSGVIGDSSIADYGSVVTFSTDIAIGANYISNDGDSEGISIDADGNVTVSDTFTISGMVAGVADYDAFIVSNGGELKYRTGDEILSDLSLSTELKSLTDAEIQQLQNINATTISTTQWGYLGALDQGLTTTSDVQFNTVTATGGPMVPAANSSIRIGAAAGNLPIIFLTLAGTGTEVIDHGGVLRFYTHGGASWLSGSSSTGGTLVSAVGAVGAPSISFNGDTTTGTYQVGAGQYGITCGGSLSATFSSTWLTLAGDLDVGGGDITFTSSGEIFAGTSDGSDTAYVGMCGGGDVSSSRGAFVVGYGNEHAADPGELRLSTGAIAAALIEFYTDNGAGATSLAMTLNNSKVCTYYGNLAIGANYISNDGDSEGISIDASGNVTASLNIHANSYTIADSSTISPVGDSNYIALCGGSTILTGAKVVAFGSGGTGALKLSHDIDGSAGFLNVVGQSGVDETTEFTIVENGDARFYFNVGIGLAPSYSLDISTASEYIARFASTDDKAYVSVIDNDTTTYWVAKDSLAAFGFDNDVTGTNSILVDTSGHLGIGTAPSYALHVDSGSATEAAYFTGDNPADDGHVAIGSEAPSGSYLLYVVDTTMDVTAGRVLVEARATKTAGATDDSDNFYAGDFLFEMDDGDSEIGYLYGVRAQGKLTSGTVGDEIYGIYAKSDLDGGTVDSHARGAAIFLDQEAANTISGNAYGAYIQADCDGTVTGTSYGLYVDARAGVSYTAYFENENTSTVVFEAGADDDSQIKLWANQGNDNADKFTIRSRSSDNYLYFLYNDEASTSIALSSAGDFYAPSIVANSGSSSGDVVHIGGNQIAIDSSSARFKGNIADMEDVWSEQIWSLRPVTYQAKKVVKERVYPNGDTTQKYEIKTTITDELSDRREIGFVAEEADALGLSELVYYADDGEVRSFNYRRYVSALHNEVRKLRERVAQLEAA